MSRKLISMLLLAAFATGTLLTSCTGAPSSTTSGGDTSKTEPSSGAASTGDAAASTGELVEFDWYMGLDPMPDNQMVNDALNAYIKDKINAKVNIHYWKGTEYEQKIPTMISSGQDLGIIGFGSQSKLDYVIQATRGAFAPLEGLLDEHAKGTKALFGDAVWDCMTIDDHIYGIPSLKDNCYIISVVYNEDMNKALDLKMEDMKYSNWRDNEEFWMDALKKRNEKFPEHKELPLLGDATLESPYMFAVDSFLNDSFLACVNIPGIDDIKGMDNKTVFNLYATDEYREFAKQKQRMVKNGLYAYDYEGKTEWQYTGGILAQVGWGYTYMQKHLYGDKFETKMLVSDHIWTSSGNYFSAGNGISVNSKNPDRIMQFLELVNTDPEVATMLRMGIEGEHYIVKDGKMQFEGSKKNGGARGDYGYYYWYGAPIGNLTIVKAPEDMVGPDSVMLTEMVRLNKEASVPAHMGFSLKLEPIANEIASCTNVVMEYRDVLRMGQLNSEAEVDKAVTEFNEKLKANGIEKILIESQKQADEFLAK